ncbi:TetR/AcrR family transcriptional regulator [Paenibacillus sp. Root52]|uniref:TetR/AcrR family transcriptional regulator n=1 Tax=Paenibacillus sp. Root52 TaxID=1736552 RepID=UPI000A63E718|nr:TetR/AcrR family transcriptional regulator [Paenibacillus sp. Root52]
MAKGKVDLRVIKTRKAIKESFLTLVQAKGYDRITVQDIADEALINRNTFYLHYVDKPDLLEKLYLENLEKLNVCLDIAVDRIDDLTKDILASVLKNLLEAIHSNLTFFKTMLSQNGQSNLSNYLKETLKTIILTGVETAPSHNLRTRIALEYLTSGLAGVICLWITDSQQISIDEFIEHVIELHFTNVVELLKSWQ